MSRTTKSSRRNHRPEKGSSHSRTQDQTRHTPTGSDAHRRGECNRRCTPTGQSAQQCDHRRHHRRGQCRRHGHRSHRGHHECSTRRCRRTSHQTETRDSHRSRRRRLHNGGHAKRRGNTSAHITNGTGKPVTPGGSTLYNATCTPHGTHHARNGTALTTKTQPHAKTHAPPSAEPVELEPVPPSQRIVPSTVMFPAATTSKTPPPRPPLVACPLPPPLPSPVGHTTLP